MIEELKVEESSDTEEQEILQNTEECEDKKAKKPIKVNILGEKEVFGDIGIFTNLKRTCTVMTRETCLLYQIRKEALVEIDQRFPRLLSSRFACRYDDENMSLRTMFVHNIPYFRSLEEATIKKIVFLLK